jgi:hypothetical protein
MVRKKGTYTGQELCARYGCVLRTIHAKEKTLGFPHGSLFGKDLVYSEAAVHAWEREHMPHLHARPTHQDEEEWQRMKSGEVERPAPKRRKPRRKK